MLIGILGDTHNQLQRTQFAVDRLHSLGAECLVHCGDFLHGNIVEACAVLPLYFVFGNNDCDTVPDLQAAAEESGATCLGWGGEFTAGEKRIAVVHGHLTSDLRPLMEQEPDYLLSGHSHLTHDFHEGPTRRINPGALHRARQYTVALLDTTTDELELIEIPRTE